MKFKPDGTLDDIQPHWVGIAEEVSVRAGTINKTNTVVFKVELNGRVH